jgi:hypothetical protein
MLVFYRSTFTELWITIQSNEPLAPLDSGYVEDYFGVDGQLTLYNVDTNSRTPVLMSEDTGETPSIPHDVFTGMVDLTLVPNGNYRVEGRVRDVIGNYRILSEVQTPFGGEAVTLYEIIITEGLVVVVSPKTISVGLRPSFSMSVGLKVKEMNVSVENLNTFNVQPQILNEDFGISCDTNPMNSNASLVAEINLSVRNVYTV